MNNLRTARVSNDRAGSLCGDKDLIGQPLYIDPGCGAIPLGQCLLSAATDDRGGSSTDR
jgi:hypothetical protein